MRKQLASRSVLAVAGWLVISGVDLLADENTLWVSSASVPTADHVSDIEGIEFRVIKKHEPQVDKFDWLHGIAVTWHGDRLFASYGHNHGKENTASEIANYSTSSDGGATWSVPELIDEGEEEENLAVSHGVFLSDAGKLWAFHGAFHGRMQNIHTRAYLWEETTGRWTKQGTVIEGGFWPMQEPQRMTDGNWIMAGLQVVGGIGKPNNPAAVAISHGDDLRKWDLVSIPKPPELNMWGESTVIIDGSKILNISRYGSPTALTSISNDFGRTWTTMKESNLPMAAAKPYAGTLSTGQHYLIGNTTADSRNRRWPLTIAVTDAHGSQFCRVYRIRNAIHDGPGESHASAALSYPYAVEREGKLYVAYSNNGGRGANRNSAELAIIPVQSLNVAPRLEPFTIERSVMTKGYDGKKCWVHARAGVIPATDPDMPPNIVVTSQPLMITGSDVFYALNSSISRDLGKTWSPLVPQHEFERWKIDDRTEETVCDFTPAWHQASGKLLGTGQTVRYFDNKVMEVRPRFTAYSVYDQTANSWGKPKTLKMPDDVRFQNCGAGSVQRFDLPDGDILLPVYFKDPGSAQYSVTVCLCHFDGTELTYVKHGSELSVDKKRGLYEPSLTKFGDRFYLTLRNDDHGYVATSIDGLTYDTPRRWTFDDGSDLGNYNTQQHWVSHPSGLFLVYTRKGANNDHVFRHRAPLFIAQVDPEKLHVIRSTEQVLVPERGARLGNFGVVNVTPEETWVIVTEWMQTWGPNVVIPVDNKYGADNSIHIAKLKWN